MLAINVSGLTKKYKKFTAVDNISFKVEQGRIYGLLGPNGAGKSTIMKVLSTLISPCAGHVEIMGYSLEKDKEKIKSIISLVSDYTVLEDDLTPYENLKMFAEISVSMNSQVEGRISSLIEDFGLSMYKDKLTKNLSSGNKQKLNIARALIKKPQILLLDEPTNAIDVETSRFIREYIVRENLESNTTVVISSHYIWEVEQIASEIGVIVNGKLAVNKKSSEIFSDYKQFLRIFELAFPKEKFSEVSVFLDVSSGVSNFRQTGHDKLIVQTDGSEVAFPDFVSVTEKELSLEDIYSHIVKKGAV
ncbi:MAG: ABC transporter ATP-binding protein [Petrotogaceae bacterium]|jgi:ABC-2 type transport system ATP-binding protein|nr:ABC transporter ATP-binding protein [Petrotogaceae bacterium]